MLSCTIYGDCLLLSNQYCLHFQHQRKKLTKTKAAIKAIQLPLNSPLTQRWLFYCHPQHDMLQLSRKNERPRESNPPTPLSAKYKEAIAFFRNFYGAALKGNDYLELAVLTGILRVAKESIFSGLNNLKVASVLQSFCLPYFGFTQEEVDKLLTYYDGKVEKLRQEIVAPSTEECLARIREWHDGYLFGRGGRTIEMYNPWSILSMLDSEHFQAYWVDTASDILLEQAFRNNLNEAVEFLEELIAGKEITVGIDENVTLQALEEKKTMNDLWSLLLFSGYLTVAEEKEWDLYALRILKADIQSRGRQGEI